MASWKSVGNMSVGLSDQGSGVVSIAVDRFTGYALLARSGGSLVFPLLSPASATR